MTFEVESFFSLVMLTIDFCLELYNLIEIKKLCISDQ